MSKLYGAGIALIFTMITASSLAVTHQLFTNYFPTTDTGGITFGSTSSKPLVYFLKSETTIETMREFGMGEYSYLDRLEVMGQKFASNGEVDIEFINENQISTLPPTATLIALDSIGLSDAAVAEIQRFLAGGGFVFFNYHFAFHGGRNYRGSQVISDITTLKHPMDLKHVSSEESLYLTPKILSPIASNILPKGSKIDLEIYDPIPIFMSKSVEPVALLTNWAVTTGLKVSLDDGQRELSADESGSLWHGRFGRGNWVYSNLPSYSFLNSNDANTQLSQLLSSIMEFSTSPLTVVTYPYLDTDKVAFISQDTEYRFESFSRFIAASNRYQIPVTAFLVAELAEKNPHLISEAERSPYIEIASHSYTHKKIIDTSAENIFRETGGAKNLIDSLNSSKKVTGFRPPREELNTEILHTLEDSGHDYVFEKRKNYQYPSIENPNHTLYTIPRNATDDYQYLVKLDWTPDEILTRMKSETDLITKLNGVYGLSVHTHLMSYKNNIDIIENYFDFLNSHPEITPLTGSDIVQRVKDIKAISYRTTKSQNNFIIDVINQGKRSLTSLSLRIYWPKNVELGEISSEILRHNPSVNHYPTRGYSDITLDKVSPESKMSLIISYR